MKDKIDIIYLINYLIINYPAKYILLSKTVGVRQKRIAAKQSIIIIAIFISITTKWQTNTRRAISCTSLSTTSCRSSSTQCEVWPAIAATRIAAHRRRSAMIGTMELMYSATLIVDLICSTTIKLYQQTTRL